MIVWDAREQYPLVFPKAKQAYSNHSNTSGFDSTKFRKEIMPVMAVGI